MMIIGVWGRIGKKLTNPNNPEAMPIVLWKCTPEFEYNFILESGIDRLAYFIETGKCYRVSDDGEIKERHNISKTIAKKIKKYLNSGNIDIREHLHPIISTPLHAQTHKLKAPFIAIN